jgi:hypothetical protein
MVLTRASRSIRKSPTLKMMSAAIFWSALANKDELVFRCQICFSAEESVVVLVKKCNNLVCERCTENCTLFSSGCPSRNPICWAKRPDGTPVMRSTSGGEMTHTFSPCEVLFPVCEMMRRGGSAMVLQEYCNKATMPQLRYLFETVAPFLTTENRGEFPWDLVQCAPMQLLSLARLARREGALPLLGTDLPPVPVEAMSEYLEKCKQYMMSGIGAIPRNVSLDFAPPVAYVVPEEFRVFRNPTSPPMSPPMSPPLSPADQILRLNNGAGMGEANDNDVVDEGGGSAPRAAGSAPRRRNRRSSLIPTGRVPNTFGEEHGRLGELLNPAYNGYRPRNPLAPPPPTYSDGCTTGQRELQTKRDGAAHGLRTFWLKWGGAPVMPPHFNMNGLGKGSRGPKIHPNDSDYVKQRAIRLYWGDRLTAINRQISANVGTVNAARALLESDRPYVPRFG